MFSCFLFYYISIRSGAVPFRHCVLFYTSVEVVIRYDGFHSILFGPFGCLRAAAVGAAVAFGFDAPVAFIVFVRGVS